MTVVQIERSPASPPWRSCALLAPRCLDSIPQLKPAASRPFRALTLPLSPPCKFSVLACQYHKVSYLQKYCPMLVSYVNSRRHPHRLPRPCRASRGPSSLPNPSRLQELLLYNFLIAITHLESALPQVFILGNLKPFRCNTYKKQGEGCRLWLTKC